MPLALLEEEIIAQCALHHYLHVLKPKGKPQSTQDQRQWTVYAAIVAQQSSGDPWVVSCATGSKCCSVRGVSPTVENVSACDEGGILHDSHAEVLTRRAFCRYLWEEIESSLASSPTTVDDLNFFLLEPLKDESPCTFQLRKDLTLHMYISDSPCGDASIYPLKQFLSEETTINFTGAKVILSDKTGVTFNQCNGRDDITSNVDIKEDVANEEITVARERGQQLLGRLRIKSSRSNIPDHLRTSSMSCSDKLIKWSIFGLQGSLLSTLIKNPIVLNSICVSLDPRATPDEQCNALRRAIPERIQAVWEALEKNDEVNNSQKRIVKSAPPNIRIVSDTIFENGKSYTESLYQLDEVPLAGTATKKRRTNSYNKDHRRAISPSGISLNWYRQRTSVIPATLTIHHKQLPSTELTVGCTGRKQGKQPKSIKDLRNSYSRLSRSCMAQCLNRIFSSGAKVEEKSATTYKTLKQVMAAPWVKDMKHLVFESISGQPLIGWVRSSSEHDFNLDRQTNVDV